MGNVIKIREEWYAHGSGHLEHQISKTWTGHGQLNKTCRRQKKLCFMNSAIEVGRQKN